MAGCKGLRGGLNLRGANDGGGVLQVWCMKGCELFKSPLTLTLSLGERGKMVVWQCEQLF